MRSIPVAYLLSLLLVNTLAYAFAYRDQSWGALAVAMVLGPSVNGILALFGGIIAWKERVQPKQMSMAKALLLPLAFLIVLEVAVFSLDLHGC